MPQPQIQQERITLTVSSNELAIDINVVFSDEDVISFI